MPPGKFLTFEGIEGAGKSTQIDLLAQYLEGLGYGVVVTREPGGTVLGELFRDLLLDDRQKNIVPMAELLVLAAARAQHIEEKIKPALKSGKWVLCDRFNDSSIAYQGAGRGLGVFRVQKLMDLVFERFIPDLTVIFDLEWKEGLRRATKNSEGDRFEKEGSKFFEPVRDAFLSLSKEDSRYKVVDASFPIEAIQNELRLFVKTRFF